MRQLFTALILVLSAASFVYAVDNKMPDGTLISEYAIGIADVLDIRLLQP